MNITIGQKLIDFKHRIRRVVQPLPNRLGVRNPLNDLPISATTLALERAKAPMPRF